MPQSGKRGQELPSTSLVQAERELESKAGKGQIVKVESLTKHGVIVAYEAKVSAAGKHSEIQVGPDGKGLNHEE